MAEQKKSGRVKRSRLGRGLSALVDVPAAVEVAGPETPSTKSDNHSVEIDNRVGGADIIHETNTVQTANTNNKARSRRGGGDQGGEVGVVEIGVGTIVANRDQPRRSFDEGALGELAASIGEHGVMQPIVVRRIEGSDSSGGGEQFELIAGERRWRASRLAGLETVPAIVREVDDATSAQLALIENVQREDLNVIELAMGYRVLLDRYSMTQEQISKKVGVSRSLVANTVRLLELPEEVRGLVGDGVLSAGHAKVLLSLGVPVKQRAMAARCLQEGWSVRELELACKEMIDGLVDGGGSDIDQVSNDLKSGVHSGDDRASSVLRDLEKRVGEELGTRVKIRTDKSRTRGRVVIEFFDLDQFDGLLGRLGVKMEG